MRCVWMERQASGADQISYFITGRPEVKKKRQSGMGKAVRAAVVVQKKSRR
jgi:hypothetical protein